MFTSFVSHINTYTPNYTIDCGMSVQEMLGKNEPRVCVFNIYRYIHIYRVIYIYKCIYTSKGRLEKANSLAFVSLFCFVPPPSCIYDLWIHINSIITPERERECEARPRPSLTTRLFLRDT